MDISIVSGTYNRIDSLQRMVASARASVGDWHYGLSYEIVLVDGNSTDGTQGWIRAQRDCRLIQHEKLLGAVKAFNDGAFAARGNYVILANDDIEFVSDSIFRAWLYMQQHPDCGIGCFYQDRNGREWHIETMPVVRNGQQSSAPYGQVCIVPKWLGDSVGWWCDKQAYLNRQLETKDRGIKPLHTYGGDNELSARVYDLGFKISPVPEAKIHDNEIADDLRKLNNITGAKDPRATRGHHPDSWSWGRKWLNRKTQLVGPVIKDKPMMDNKTPVKDRILYLPIFEPGWPVLKEQKRGLREALSRRALVVEYDYVNRFAEVGHQGMMTDLMNIISRIQPTIVLTQLHNGANIGPGDISILRKAAKSALFVNWNGDYWPDNLLSDDGIKLARAFDLMTSVNLEAVEKYQAVGINARYWQIGFEPEGIGQPPGEVHDVVFLGSGYSKARQDFGRWLKRLNGFSVGIYGLGWPNGVAQGQNLYNFSEACKIYRAAKISLGDSQWPDSGFVSNRIMQALAAGGAALAHQWFRGMDDLGLVDGQTCIIWRNRPELEQKIRHYLSHEDERRRIAENGEKLALQRHSFDARVAELFEMIQGKEPKPQEIAEDWRW